MSAVFALAAACFVAFEPVYSHYSPDCAAKYLAVASIRNDGGGWRYDVPYVGKTLDPGMGGIPIGESYFDRRDGEVHISWPELFPFVVYPFFRLLGWYGCFVVPVLCGALSVYFCGRIAESIRERSGLLASVLAALMTPIFFYSTLYWEHTAALALLLGATWLATSHAQRESFGRVIGAGACVGLAAAGLRTDANLFFAALLGGLFLCAARWRRVGIPALATAGFVLGATPAAAINWMTNGKLLAANTGKNTPRPSLHYLFDAGPNVLTHFFVGRPNPIGAAWLIVLGAFALVVVLSFVRGPRRAWLALASATVLALGSAIVLKRTYDASTSDFHGWLAMSPLLAIGASRVRLPSVAKASAHRLLSIISGLFCAANFAALVLAYPNAWAADGNVEWGPRYWLAIFPLMSILTAVAVCTLAVPVRGAELFILGGAAALLAIVGIGYEALGLSAILRNEASAAVIRTALEQRGDEPILFDHFMVSSMSPNQFFERPSFYAAPDNRRQFDAWFIGMRAHGVVDFDFATFGDPLTHPFVAQPSNGWRFAVGDVVSAHPLSIVRIHASPIEAGVRP